MVVVESVSCAKGNVSGVIAVCEHLHAYRHFVTLCAKNFPQVRLVSPCSSLALLKVLLGVWLLGNLTLCGRKLVHGVRWVHLLLSAQARVCSSRSTPGVCHQGIQELRLHPTVPAGCWRGWQTSDTKSASFGGEEVEDRIWSHPGWAGLQIQCCWTAKGHTYWSLHKEAPCHYHCPAGYA